MRLSSLPGVSEKSIIEVQEKLNFVFPLSFKKLYLKGNKYSINEWELYPIKDGRYINKTWDDIIRANEELKNEISGDFIVIGDNGTGNHLGYKMSANEELFVWNHESNQIIKVSDSLESFIDSESNTISNNLSFSKDSNKKVTHFIDRVKSSRTVYGLSKDRDEGWAYAPSNEEDTDVLLFFSTESYALACKKEEWSNYHLIKLPLRLFIDVWLPNMEEDELLCGVDWNQNLIGSEISPTVLLDLFRMSAES
ncbi:DUF2750 domain-containing protein [Exiguobacterium sp. s142]|uniref:DUF2750 domain-containing protein n=1 Tax=Exiguobacterium sp. s142 TaxID=2751222 RepID=UPI001BEACBB2|nr:DUF2750 domain-containing protein [Exiguobacterium sp. s142]